MLSKERGQYFQEQYNKLEYQFANNELQQKCNQLQSNWNSLREWLKEYSQDLEFRCYMDMVLDKMNELEGVKND